MITTLKYCPVSLADMLAEANNPKSYARLSPVRAGWFIGRLQLSWCVCRASLDRS